MIEKEIGKILTRRRKTLAVAESCTGGLLCHRITNVPGSSDYFLGGVVAYCNDSKTRDLSVSKKILKAYGAVSAPCARQMALGARKKFKSDYSLSVTGIAGPTGATPGKPVGLTYIAVASPRGVKVRKFVFSGKRLAVKEKAAAQALELLRSELMREHRRRGE